jgi:putative hydrolase of the HAD superfamily
MSGGRRSLLFDFGGTLDADGVRWSVRFHDAYRGAGGALDYAAFEPVFRASDQRLAALPGIRTAGLRAMIQVQAALLGRLLPDLPRGRAALMAAEFHRGTMAAIDRNRALVERLARSHRLGVVSNFTGNLGICLEEVGLLRSFSAVADSGVLGVDKPDPRIFLAALSELGAHADEAWMIGDNFDNDVRPAARLGMRTCWLAPAGSRVPPDLAPTARVSHLTDIEGLWR